MPENYSLDRDYSLDTLKIPPNSIQAEQSVLGGLMLDNLTWDSIADKVVEIDFYRRSHQLIFRIIEELAEKQRIPANRHPAAEHSAFPKPRGPEIPVRDAAGRQFPHWPSGCGSAGTLG